MNLKNRIKQIFQVISLNYLTFKYNKKMINTKNVLFVLFSLFLTIFIINYRSYYIIFLWCVYCPETIHLLKYINFIYNDKKHNMFTILKYKPGNQLYSEQPMHIIWNKYCEFNAYKFIYIWNTQPFKLELKILLIFLIAFLLSVPIKILVLLHYIMWNYNISIPFTIFNFCNEEINCFKNFNILQSDNLQFIIINDSEI